MKNGKLFLGMAVLLAAAIILGGCPNFLSPTGTSSEGETGRGLLIHIGDDSGVRTLFPRSDFSRYVISFTGPEGYSHPDITLNGSSNSTRVDLAAGVWTITVKAYMGIDANYDGTVTESIYDAGTNTAGEEFEAASWTGTQPIAGVPETISIQVGATQGGAPGFFAYEVKFPQAKVDSDKAKLYIKNIDGSPIDLDIDLLNPVSPVLGGTAVNDGMVTASGMVELPAGYYVVRTVLENAYHRAGRAEIVHIYSGMETNTATADWSFDEDDFVDYITLEGTLTGLTGDKIVVELYRQAVTAEDLPDLVPLARGEVTLGAWSIPITPYTEDTDLYFAIAVLNGSDWTWHLPGTLSQTVNGDSIDNIVLSVSPASATVGSATISGNATTPITSTDLILSLTNATFTAQTAGTVSWITNLPTGLQAAVKNDVSAGAASLTLTVSGTPTVAASGPVTITIPVTALQGVLSGITITTGAAYNIAGPGKTFTVTGIPQNAAGMYYELGLFTDRDGAIAGTANPVAYHGGWISPTSISGTLLESGNNPWTGSDSYYVGIVVYEDPSHLKVEAAFITDDLVSFNGAGCVLAIGTDLKPVSYTIPVRATVQDVVAAGVQGQYQSMEATVTVNLEGGPGFTGINAEWNTGDDISGWFSDLPLGLTARAGNIWQDYDAWVLEIRISGTPTAVSTAAISLTIPDDKLTDNGGMPMTTVSNPNARFHITGTGTSLSGSIAVYLDGAPFDAGELPFGNRYGVLYFYTDENFNGGSFTSAAIQANGSWTVTIPSDLGTIHAGVSLPNGSGGYYSNSQYVGSHTGSDPWNMGQQDFISLSGTASATVNTVSVANQYMSIQARDVTSGDNDPFIGSSGVEDGSGNWRIILSSVSGPREIRLDMHINGGSYSDMGKDGIWTGSVTTTKKDDFALTQVFQIVEGTIGDVTVGGSTADMAAICAMDTDGKFLGEDWTTPNSPWTLDVGDYSGTIRFLAGTYRSADSLLIMAPLLASPSPPVSGGTGTTGVSIGNVAITTDNVSVTVKNGASDIPCLVGVTLVPLTFEEMRNSFPVYKAVTVPYGSEYSMPSLETGWRDIPVADGHPQSMHFVVMTPDERYYVTNSAVNTSTAVTLNIASGMGMTELTSP